MSAAIFQPTIPSLTIGGRVITDLANLIVLYGYSNSSATSRCSLRKVNTSTGYTPSGTKVFQAVAVRIQTLIVATSGLALGYADTDIGLGVNTAHTSPQYLNVLPPLNGAVGIDFQFPCEIRVPNGKYFASDSQGSVWVGNIIVYGFEV